MYVIFRTVRRVIVDDHGDSFDVQTPCGHVGGNENARLPRFELLQGLLALLLVLVAVHRIRRDAVLPEHPHQHIALLLHGDEDQDSLARPAVQLQRLNQGCVLVVGGIQHPHLLTDVFVGRQRGWIAHLHVDRHVQKVMRQLLHFLGPGGAEHQRLPPLRHLFHDVSDLGLEAHVQHPIRLIKDAVAHATQVDVLVLQEVVEPPGRGHQDGRAGAHRRQLLSFGLAPVHARTGAARGRGELHGLVVDLGGQLPRGRQNQCLHAHALSGVHPAIGRHQEAQRLPGPRLCNANDVPALLKKRPHLCLDGRRSLETGRLEGREQRLGQASLRVCGERVRNGSCGAIRMPSADLILQAIRVFLLVIRSVHLRWSLHLLGCLLHVAACCS
mmetsp:Transcript_137599/g.325924  ORF Transcript_137599/g.325924 Transcript_137599/m.325924 type:complete len:385 (+) Transcript_137599:2297-3451(+)